jgi:hypothetical protein
MLPPVQQEAGGVDEGRRGGAGVRGCEKLLVMQGVEGVDMEPGRGPRYTVNKVKIIFHEQKILG